MPPVPGVTVTKNPFALAALPPSADGILAIIAAASAGVAGQCQTFANPNLLASTKGFGPLPEYGAYVMNVANKPILAMNPVSETVTGSYGTIVVTHAGADTFTATSTAATFPFDHYAVVITFQAAGTLGTAGITYTYSLDGGNSTSAVQALGTGLIIAIPNSGVSITLATTGTSTVAKGSTIVFPTERPLMNDTDVAASLNQLALTRQPWEGVLIDQQFGVASVAVIDGILAGLEAKGQFKWAITNTRYKNEPLPATETEAVYLTALTTTMGTQVSQRMVVGADGGHVASGLTGLNIKRPVSMFAAAAIMALTPNIGVDPAYVGNGPCPGAVISDANSNPFDHDEDLYPGLDNIQLTTLRTFAAGGPQGTYLTNVNVIGGLTSNIQYIQHLRVMNKACTIAWQILAGQLSLGVHSQFNSTTNQLNIQEKDAQKIEGLINPPLNGALQGQVTAVAFALNRDDNLQLNPVTLNGQVSIVPLIYIKDYAVSVAFTKNIAAAT